MRRILIGLLVGLGLAAVVAPAVACPYGTSASNSQSSTSRRPPASRRPKAARTDGFAILKIRPPSRDRRSILGSRRVARRWPPLALRETPVALLESRRPR